MQAGAGVALETMARTTPSRAAAASSAMEAPERWPPDTRASSTRSASCSTKHTCGTRTA